MGIEYTNFFWFLLLGGVVGVFYSLLSALVYVFKKNVVVQIIADLIFCAGLGLSFMFLINKLNSGEIRWFLVLAVAIGFIIYIKTLGKLFAKVGSLLYNHLVKLSGKFKTTKVGKVLYK